jgi:hypothetical protein
MEDRMTILGLLPAKETMLLRKNHADGAVMWNYTLQKERM